MRLYDKPIESCLALLSGREGRRLEFPASDATWPDAGERNLVLKSEAAYELGGGTLPALSGLGLTSSESLVGDDELWLYGPDLSELRADSPYARLVFLRVAEGGLGEGDAAYAAIRRIEYVRYRINPRGYMMRISASNERESVRVGREALGEGLNFAKVGGLFLDAYRRQPGVLSARLIFVTLPDFPYGELGRQLGQAERITESLDHIFQHLRMDCSTCGLKTVCDEVEGLRELHFAQAKD
jgi:hypothetical protein